MDSLANQFLIAMPALNDPNFARTVTLICQHNEEGALGIVINRTTDLQLSEILQQVNLTATNDTVSRLPVYSGGPVHGERGFVLHEELGEWQSTLPIAGNLGLTTSQDILQAMADDRGPRSCLVALGYAGWGSGQLEQELQQNAWLNGPADNRIIFRTPAEHRWTQAAASLGVDVTLISREAGHA